MQGIEKEKTGSELGFAECGEEFDFGCVKLEKPTYQPSGDATQEAGTSLRLGRDPGGRKVLRGYTEKYTLKIFSHFLTVSHLIHLTKILRLPSSRLGLELDSLIASPMSS